MDQVASAAFFGQLGVAISLAFASKSYKITIIDCGAAYGTAKAGIGIASMGVLKPDMIVRSIVPIVMASILGIYGLIVSVILLQKSKASF
jgi:V-type H+-transporting ATPase proteolipid subunit